MPVRGVVCDLDGVLRSWATTAADGARIEAEYGLAPGRIFAALMRPDRLQNAVTGRVSDAAWRAAAAQELAEEIGPTAAAMAITEFSAGVGVLDLAVVDALQVWRANGPVIVLTNGTDRLDADLEQLGLRVHVDAVVNSADTGRSAGRPSISGRSRTSEQVIRVLDRFTRQVWSKRRTRG